MVDLIPNARQVFVNANGSPLAGGQVFMYVPNTTVPKTTYSDQAGTIPNQNPIPLDDLGSATIWGMGLYRQIVQDNAGNTIYDDLTAPAGDLSSTGTNAGIVAWFAADTPPSGFLECNGQAVSRTTYNLLFATIGTNWGVGDGSTTFNVPDFRGYFIRGWDDSADRDTGRSFGSTQTDAVNQSDITVSMGSLAVAGTIAGSINVPGTLFAGVGAASGGQNTSSSNFTAVAVTAGQLIPTLTVSGAPAVVAQTETRPINVALLPCISTGAGLGGTGGTGGGILVLNVNIITGASSPYTLLPASDAMVLCNTTGGAIGINPPDTPVPGQIFTVKDLAGTASTHSIVLNFEIDGATTTTITTNYESVSFMLAETGIWTFVSLF